MLSYLEIPETLSSTHAASRELARSLVNQLADLGMSRAFARKQPLHLAARGHLLFVEKGMLEHHLQGKLLRFYSKGDLVDLTGDLLPDTEITSDFGVHALLLPRVPVLEALTSRNLVETWWRFQQLSQQILLGLQAVQMKEQFTPAIDLREFSAGETLIREGDTPDCLFEMLEGTARVEVQGTSVGQVGPGELFGEVSFLTHGKRTASVIAETHCLAHAIGGEHFDELVKARPSLVLSLSQTLARRLREMNQRLTWLSSRI